MPHALLHALNIGTLSTWLSLAGFGTVGVILKPWHGNFDATAKVEETQVFENDFLLGEESVSQPEGGAADTAIPEVPEIPADVMPAPPELPPLAETAPLPEIPELPEVAPPSAKPASEMSREVRSKPQPRAESRPSSPRPRAGGTATGKPSSGSQGGADGGGSGMSSASRLAAGRMPAPSYPSESRRKGQTGTVVVEFTVDASGRVISAYAKTPSPWPLLNNEAVRTVRRWKFPPGGIMKLQRPIVFQLR